MSGFLILFLLVVTIACHAASGDVGEPVAAPKKTAVAADTDTDDDLEPDILGLITEETGSIFDYEGWWVMESDAPDAPDFPFTCFSIRPEDDVELRAYDASGAVVDTGVTDYSEQRQLNGKSLIVLDFYELGQFGTNAYSSTDDTHFLEVEDDGKALTFIQTEAPPFDRDAADILMDALAEDMEGKTLIETGEEEIDGELCTTFVLGTDMPERFAAEAHFAVSPAGDVYIMDILQEGKWVPYEN